MVMNPTSTPGIKRFVDPSKVVSHFYLREGDVIADYGAGSGFFAEILASKVGSTGRVYACDIQKDLVDKVGVLARTKGLSMIDPLWCDLEEERGLKINDGILDAGIMVNVLFQLENKHIALQEVNRTLRSGGKFFLIDWSESFGGLGPQPDEVVSMGQAQALVEEHGFVYERTFDAGDHHYGLAFRKI
jgi:ubiquinone/menaquinone biosynthesis C-methylase UbiE